MAYEKGEKFCHGGHAAAHAAVKEVRKMAKGGMTRHNNYEAHLKAKEKFDKKEHGNHKAASMASHVKRGAGIGATVGLAVGKHLGRSTALGAAIGAAAGIATHGASKAIENHNKKVKQHAAHLKTRRAAYGKKK